MPLVFVDYDRENVPGDVVQNIARKLPIIVATTLDSSYDGDGSDAALTEDDVEVIVREDHPFDVNSVPLAIIIWANDFPKRKVNIQERADTIKFRVGNNIPERIEFFVWVLLAPTGFSWRSGEGAGDEMPTDLDDHVRMIAEHGTMPPYPKGGMPA